MLHHLHHSDRKFQSICRMTLRAATRNLITAATKVGRSSQYHLHSEYQLGLPISGDISTDMLNKYIRYSGPRYADVIRSGLDQV